jgi:hypothetical protein
VLNANVTTSGAQTYNDAVTLGANVALIGTNVTFNNTVTGSGKTLTLGSASVPTNGVFSGAVGSAVAPLGATEVKGAATFGRDVHAAALTVGGITALNANVTTTAGQTYNGALVVGVDATVKGTNLTFNTIDADTANTRMLTVQGNGQITFNGDAGSSSATGLKALTVSNDNTATGSTTFKGSNIRATDLTVNDAFLLGADVSVTTAQATFNNRVDSAPEPQARELRVGGKAEFKGTVGNIARLGRVSVSGNAGIGNVWKSGALDVGENAVIAGVVDAASVSVNGTALLRANVTTSGNQTYTGAVTVDANEVEIRGGNVSFKSTVDGLPNQATQEGRNLTLNAESLIFGGRVGTPNAPNIRDLVLKAPSVRTDEKFSIAYSGQGTMDVNVSRKFEMAQGQKLINPSGGLSLTAGWQIYLGDILVNGDIKVDPPGGTFVQGRNPIPGVPGDTGVNIVGNNISFDQQLQFAPGTPQKVNFETATGGVTGLVEAPGISFYKTPIAGSRAALFSGYAAALAGGASTGLSGLPGLSDLAAAAAGLKFLRAAEALAGALAEQESPELMTETSISAAKIHELEFLGIYARLATKEEQQTVSERRGYFNQFLKKLELEAPEYQVVVNRITKRQVDELLARFDQLFYSHATGERVDRHADIQQAFGEVHSEYLAAGATSPKGFRAFVAQTALENPKAKQVLDDLQGVRNLFQQIDRMGFTPKEAQLSKESIILDLGVDVMTPQEILDLVELQGDVRILPTEPGPSSTEIKLPVEFPDLPKTTRKKKRNGAGAPEAAVQRKGSGLSSMHPPSRNGGTGLALAH